MNQNTANKLPAWLSGELRLQLGSWEFSLAEYQCNCSGFSTKKKMLKLFFWERILNRKGKACPGMVSHNAREKRHPQNGLHQCVLSIGKSADVCDPSLVILFGLRVFGNVCWIVLFFCKHCQTVFFANIFALLNKACRGTSGWTSGRMFQWKRSMSVVQLKKIVQLFWLFWLSAFFWLVQLKVSADLDRSSLPVGSLWRSGSPASS